MNNATIRALKEQKSLTPFPYYSTVRFLAPQAGAGPYTYTLPSTERKAFAYAIGDAKTVAGFASTETATVADTNLQRANQTTSGDVVMIRGICVQAKPGALTRADASSRYRLRRQSGKLIAALFDCCNVELSLNGTQRYQLGAIGNVPGGSGLFGTAADDAGIPAFSGGPPPLSFANNGWPTRSNFFKLPEGINWNPPSKESSDQMLNVIFKPSRDIVLDSGDFDNQLDDVAAATGVQAYNFPTELVVDLRVLLVAEVLSPRTRVS